jgi:ABC-2 type transport system ATP-binding protein
MAESNEAVVITVGLCKVFRDFWLREKVTAVSDLDLEVAPRQVFGLLGPNGSGKSTTIKMILGLLFPTRGRITVFGKRPTDVISKARIGFLPEESYLYPFLNARETLDFYGRLFHQPRAERLRRIDMLLEMVGLASVAYRRVGEYSKGMQRRIGLAQALINDPDLLILDEPTSGMDPIGTKQFKDLIQALARRGKTVILSSHLLADVEDVCDRVSILYGGKQRAVGDMGDLLAQRSCTQITTDELDAATVEKVRQVLEKSGRSLVSVATPRDRLEALFLRIVKEAQEQRVRTGGAVAGGQVAEFLLREEPQGRQVIQEMLAKAERLEPDRESAAAPPPRPAPVAEDVLRQLVTAKDRTPQAEPAEEAAAPPRPAPTEPQQDVIRQLLDKNGREEAPPSR